MSFITLFHLRQKIQSKKVGFSKKAKDESGQSFIEFLFLLLILMGLSMTMTTGFNNTIAKRWKAIVEAIAIPNDTDTFEL
mgnify:FL=1